MRRTTLFGIVVAQLFTPTLGATSLEERRDYLDWMLENLPQVPVWNEWQKKTGELPPDFDAFPRVNGLPDPLRFLDGRSVETREDWQARRAEIRKTFEKYLFGPIPPRPRIEDVEVTEARGNGYRTLDVVLRAGPEGGGVLHVTLVVPLGDGPFPVLMGPGLADRAPAGPTMSSSRGISISGALGAGKPWT